MKVDGISSRRRLVLVAASSVVLALGAAACGGSGAQMSASSEAGVAVTEVAGGPTDPTTVPPTVTVMGATTDPATTTASASTNPAPTAAPATSAPATTSGMTWVTIKPPLVSIISIPPILFTPTVTSVSVSGTVGCFSGLTPVSWTTSNASGVNIEVDGVLVINGYPGSGTANLNIAGRGCSQTHTVKVTALYSNGTAGGSKSASVYVNWI